MDLEDIMVGEISEAKKDENAHIYIYIYIYTHTYIYIYMEAKHQEKTDKRSDLWLSEAEGGIGRMWLRGTIFQF